MRSESRNCKWSGRRDFNDDGSNDELEQESIGFKEIITMSDKMKWCPTFHNDSQDMLSTITKRIEDLQIKNINIKYLNNKYFWVNLCQRIFIRVKVPSLSFTILRKQNLVNIFESVLCQKILIRVQVPSLSFTILVKNEKLFLVKVPSKTE